MKSVMVVDDSGFMRRYVVEIAQKHGFMVVAEAEDGDEAVEKYDEYRPDIVTMDITMKRMDGLTALKKIKASDKRAKVVMVTAMGQECIMQEALLEGARGFVVKPISEEMLLAALRRA